MPKHAELKQGLWNVFDLVFISVLKALHVLCNLDHSQNGFLLVLFVKKKVFFCIISAQKYHISAQYATCYMYVCYLRMVKTLYVVLWVIHMELMQEAHLAFCFVETK